MRIFFFISCLLAIVACEKHVIKPEDKRLPVRTQNGRGMFACRFDNQTYIAKRIPAISYNPESGYLFIESIADQFEFRLFVYQGVFTEGFYQVDSTGEEYVAYPDHHGYGVYPGGTNELLIQELDLEKGIVSGTFELDLMDKWGQEKKVTEGQFDLSLNSEE